MPYESNELPVITEEQLITSLSDLLDEQSIRNIWKMRVTDKIDIDVMRRAIENIQDISRAKIEVKDDEGANS